MRDLLVTRDFATNINYHPSGALIGYTSGNGVPSTFTYHPSRYWITSLSVGSHWSLQYQNYDDVGNVQSMVDSRAGMNQDLTYDELDRLASVTAGSGLPSASWAYDIHGNRTDANGTTYTYYAGTLRLWTQNTDTYTYDNNGNLLTATTPARSFSYTAWNRVASATMGGTTTNYRYAADDWRVKKSSGTTKTYLLRGLNGELLTEWKNPGTNGETRDYVYAGSPLITAIKRQWNETSDWYGTIIPGGPPVTVTLTIPDQRAWLTFEGTAGQRVSLWGFNGMTGQILGCDVNVSILKPPDNSVLAPATCMEGSGFIDTVTLPLTGTYTVLVDPVNNSVGSLTLRLYDVPADLSGTIVAGGSDVALTFTTPGQNGELTFTGTQGQRVTLWGFNAMSGQVSLTCDVNIRIVKPDNTDLVPNTCMEGGGFIDVLTLPATGTYRIPMNPEKWATGPLSLRLYDVPADLNLSIVPGGASVPMNFNVPGLNATLTFTGAANQRIALRGTNCMSGQVGLACDVTVTILKPDLTPLAPGTCMEGSGWTDVKVLPVPGQYTITVDPLKWSMGGLTLTLYDVPGDFSGSLVIGGSAVAVPLTTPGQNGSVTFTATAGQPVTVRMTGNTIGSTTIRLFRPDGSFQASVASAAASFNMAAQTLATPGVYTVTVDPYQAAAGTINVAVTSP